MKLDTSPAAEPRAGWQETILRARGAVERLTEESPSLRPLATRMIRKELPRARRIAAAALNAHGGQPRVAFSALTYSEEQVLGDWLPAANGDAGSSPQPA
jgi:HEAT repeat protein